MNSAGDLRLAFGDSAAGSLIANLDHTFDQHFLNFTQAQVKPQLIGLKFRLGDVTRY
jgi:hypothetical protein